MNLMARLQIIGGGKMGVALLEGLVSSGWANAAELHVVEPEPIRQQTVKQRVAGVSVSLKIINSDAVIAVKPHVVTEMLPMLADAGVPRVLSIAAGVRCNTIEAALADGTPVVRAMPNTPALVGLGAAAIASGSSAGHDDLQWARSILEAVGTVVEVDEADLDTVTGLSGSGPAYVFELAEALRNAGVVGGLDPQVSDTLVRQTLLGAATLLASTGEDPVQLRDNVTTPGGTTAAGLAVLDEVDFMSLIERVVDTASRRSRELGR